VQQIWGSKGLIPSISRTAGIVALVLTLFAGRAQADTPRDQSTVRLASALQGLQRYAATHSLKDLDSTVESTGLDMSTIAPSDYLLRRRQLLQVWIQIFRVIERSPDLSYDPNDPRNVVYNCVTPPQDADGSRAPACADPRVIKDPNARAQYVAAIAENKAKAARLQAYYAMKQLDNLAMTSLQVELQEFRNWHAPPDSAALETTLRQSGLSAKRVTTIEAML